MYVYIRPKTEHAQICRKDSLFFTDYTYVCMIGMNMFFSWFFLDPSNVYIYVLYENMSNVYICVYVWIYIDIYVYMYECIYIYIYIYILPMCTCDRSIYIHTYWHIYIHALAATNCVSNPFPELPPGFLCTSTRFGAYLVGLCAYVHVCVCVHIYT
jgi:hypothetical protein